MRKLILKSLRCIKHKMEKIMEKIQQKKKMELSSQQRVFEMPWNKTLTSIKERFRRGFGIHVRKYSENDTVWILDVQKQSEHARKKVFQMEDVLRETFCKNLSVNTQGKNLTKNIFCLYILLFCLNLEFFKSHLCVLKVNFFINDKVFILDFVTVEICSYLILYKLKDLKLSTSHNLMLTFWVYFFVKHCILSS